MTKTQALKQQQNEEISFPFTYSKPRSSFRAKIYRTPRNGYDAFTLMYYQGGERKRVLFGSLDAAMKEADDVAKLLGSKDVDVLELRSADRAAYRRARELLDPLDI